MRNVLIVFFCAILVTMLGITGYASLDRGIWDAGGELMQHPWFIATLADAYFAFLTFYVWVFVRETSWLARTGWLIAILLLGSIAMSAYMLRALFTGTLTWPANGAPAVQPVEN
jgi:predicted permease